ncbi:MAG: recombinase, partial [Actinobacteria bacterium]|nr:recombinase [Actinomycetota bacterium]
LDHESYKRLIPYIDEAYRAVLDKKVLPSMRSGQFAGEANRRNHTRGYNCSAMSVSNPAFFRELMFLLMSGTGVGYSVQRVHTDRLPDLTQPGPDRRYVIQDSIIGWSDAVDQLAQAFFYGAPYPIFDFVEIRPEGELLKVSGGRAPGPEPLRKSLELVAGKFWEALKRSERLEPIDAHDISCYVAEAVLSGGIRRSAMISLFSPDDAAMLKAKDGAWWEVCPQRAYANNSAVLLRGRDDHHFDSVFDHARDSGSGEPGVYWTDDNVNYLTNPCGEINLRDMQFCNLTTINVGDVTNQADLNARTRATTILGTLQAAYTDFHYLRPEWRANTEEEALLGVSMTGIAAGAVLNLDVRQAARVAVEVNAEVAEIIGINPAARVTTVKPEGSGSLVLGTSSGIHAWFDDYYIRRMRFNKGEPIAQYLVEHLPYTPEMNESDPEIVEDDFTNPNQIILSIPVKAPDGAITREEGAISLLE